MHLWLVYFKFILGTIIYIKVYLSKLDTVIERKGSCLHLRWKLLLQIQINLYSRTGIKMNLNFTPETKLTNLSVICVWAAHETIWTSNFRFKSFGHIMAASQAASGARICIPFWSQCLPTLPRRSFVNLHKAAQTKEWTVIYAHCTFIIKTEFASFFLL